MSEDDGFVPIVSVRGELDAIYDLLGEEGIVAAAAAIAAVQEK